MSATGDSDKKRQVRHRTRKQGARKRRWVFLEDIHHSCSACTARRMLLDCLQNRRDLDSAEMGTTAWRNAWVGTIAVLRGIGHALAKEDALRSRYLAVAVETAWERWKNDLYSSQVFFGFIDAERNDLLKGYRFINQRKIYSQASVESFAAQHQVLIAGQAVPPSTAAKIAWNWIRREIQKVEAHADSLRIAERQTNSFFDNQQC